MMSDLMRELLLYVLAIREEEKIKEVVFSFFLQ